MPALIADARVSAAGRTAQDLGAAALFGGNLFARVGMHPALRSVTRPRERGEVVNRAWRRYGSVNTISLLSILAGWGLAHREEAAAPMLSARERELAKAKDAVVAAVALTGVASAVNGVRFARKEPLGAVPLNDGSTAAPEAPPREVRAKRLLNALSAVHLLASGALVAINASRAPANARRPPARGLLRRRR